jgi:hypothetical protein
VPGFVPAFASAFVATPAQAEDAQADTTTLPAVSVDASASTSAAPSANDPNLPASIETAALVDGISRRNPTVDVLYGPFSALYPDNSLGATVLINTRMPKQFEATGVTGRRRLKPERSDTACIPRSIAIHFARL